jgi:hypothetical protein
MTTLTAIDKFVLGVAGDLRRKCDTGLERIDAFIRCRRQVEGWFKGELLTIAAQMLDDGKVREFRPDCRTDKTLGKNNIDLHFITGDGEPVWIELKHWYLGKYEGGARWSVSTYCTQSTSATPNNFIKKLPPRWLVPTYMLIVMTPAPQSADWSRALVKLEQVNSDWNIGALTVSNNFPPSYFIGLLKLQRKFAVAASTKQGDLRRFT